MGFIKNLLNKYTGLATAFKGFFVLVILFLLFFAVNLMFTIKNKDKSAYTTLSSDKSKVKLQDTRVHNWSELEKKK